MASPYDKIVDMIKKLDLQDDGIVMNQKIKSIEQDFCNVVLDEAMLSESMEYINDQVLSDKDASQKFALLFSSRNFDSLAMNDTKVRSKMLNILQTNYLNSDLYKKDDKAKLYNSITLLGEYYHRVRLADGSPITVLGTSLLGLLTKELCPEEEENSELPNIDLKLAKLILSQVTLNGTIMRSAHREELNTLLFHIRKNLIEVPNHKPAVKALLLMTLDLYYSNFTSLGDMLEEMYTKYLVEEDKCSKEEPPHQENGGTTTEEPKKKWSEQVCEDYEYETVPNDYCDSPPRDERTTTQHPTEDIAPHRDQPRNNYNNNNNNSNNRYNPSYDEDRHSVRSEGGSIRIYSVSDRLKFSQRGGGGGGNQNWDRNNDRKFHTFDRSRRSNSRNRNQYDNSNFYNKNNRNYNKPPRFSNNNNNNNSNNTNNNDSWRSNSDFNRGRSMGPESNSRSNSQNRNIPRPPRNYDNFNGRSLSPESCQNSSNRGFNRNGQHRQQTRNFGNSRNNRYSSHSSLNSDTGTWERRGRRRNSRGKSQEFFQHDDTHSLQDPNETPTWNDHNNEIVKNARDTAEYMQYLSKK